MYKMADYSITIYTLRRIFCLRTLQQLDSKVVKDYIGVLISLRLFIFPIFLFAAQPKEFFLVGLKKLEQ
jgi:hypothetical protein